jgi:hypothetical protein
MTVVTFAEARAIVVAAVDSAVAEYGWENDDVFVVALDYGDEPTPFDEPDRLVDKGTGELREVYGLLGRAPAPGLRPIGDVPA